MTIKNKIKQNKKSEFEINYSWILIDEKLSLLYILFGLSAGPSCNNVRFLTMKPRFEKLPWSIYLSRWLSDIINPGWRPQYAAHQGLNQTLCLKVGRWNHSKTDNCFASTKLQDIVTEGVRNWYCQITPPSHRKSNYIRSA